MFVLPTTVAPASSNRRTTVASMGGTYPSMRVEPFVSSMPATLTLSFRPTASPSSGPPSSPSISHFVIQALYGSSQSSGR
jgi:hypothetical protein